DRDRLLGRTGAVLALANVLHLLADELSRLRARRLSLGLVLLCSLQRLFVWHRYSFERGLFRRAPMRQVEQEGCPFRVRSAKCEVLSWEGLREDSTRSDHKSPISSYSIEPD